MSKENRRIQFLQNQIEGFKMQAMYRHAEIVSGGYKICDSGRSDDEKLERSLEIMRRQIHLMNEFNDALGTIVSADRKNTEKESFTECDERNKLEPDGFDRFDY